MATDVKKLIEQMTLEEKASLLGGDDFWHTKPIERLGIPRFMMSDGPHGLRKQAEGGDHLGMGESIKAVCFPAACATASSFDPDLLYEMGDAIGEVGRYYYNRSDEKGGYSQHTTVGSYLPNAWGLYDMHGNVWEWCLDWYASYAGNATDPKGASSGYYRVLRGGSWNRYASRCRSAGRSGDAPDYGDSDGYGFRIALVQ